MRFQRVFVSALLFALLFLVTPHLSLHAQNDTGGKLAYGDTYYTTITPDFPFSLWEFNGTANDKIQITVTRLSGALVPAITLSQVQSSTGNPPETNAVFSDDKVTATISLTLPENSPYQLALKGASTDVGEFRISLARPNGADSSLKSAATVAPTDNAVSIPKIGGTYSVFRTELVGFHEDVPSTLTEGQVTITPAKAPGNYQMDWAFGDNKFVGLGIGQGDFLASTYGDKGCINGLYHLNDRDGLDAQWGDTKDYSAFGTEHLSRVGSYQKDKISGQYVVSGTNPDNPKPYRGTVNIDDWSSYLTFVWHFGKDLIHGDAIQRGNLIALSGGDSAGKLNCGVMAFTIKADGSLEGKGRSAGTGIGALMSAFPSSANPSTSTTKPLALGGDYTISRVVSGGTPIVGKLTIKPNLYTYDLAWTFPDGTQAGVGLRLGDQLAIASGAKACAIFTHQPVPDPHFASQFAALGDVISLNLGSADLTKLSTPLRGAQITYAAILNNENHGTIVDGYLDVTKADDGIKMLWHFGNNDFNGVGLQQGDQFESILPLGSDKVCSLRVLQFKPDGSFMGTEITMQSQVATRLEGSISTK